MEDLRLKIGNMYEMILKIDKMYKQRMYFFVPYNISDIQKGIQAGHALVEYQLNNGNTDAYKSFAKYDKTFIILNGGTTNNDISSEYYGSLNKILQDLRANFIDYGSFYEPDLNNALSCVCFLADERVYDFANYPTFEEYRELHESDHSFYNEYSKSESELMNDWINFIGGGKNVFLKNLIQNKKLA